jgi:hypothetical protein
MKMITGMFGLYQSWNERHEVAIDPVKYGPVPGEFSPDEDTAVIFCFDSYSLPTLTLAETSVGRWAVPSDGAPVAALRWL